MATAQRLSPSARLMRNSRFFTLPPPLPPLQPLPTHMPFVRESDTATQPYPTHQALETTQSSLARGDWGLKRPIPTKGIKTKTSPTIRIKAVDSIEHITDYSSAADHVNTLRKWQEMGIPLLELKSTKKASRPGEMYGTSVFEEWMNSTDRTAPSSKRWKFDGPWIAGQSRGEFQDFLEKVGPKRAAFREYLRTKLAQGKVSQQRRMAREEGRLVSNEPARLSDEELDSEVARLRQATSSLELWSFIWEFLDLPGTAPMDVTKRLGGHAVDSPNPGMEGRQFDPDRGPPSTHPSAGLSYLRTASHIPNHPLLGPVSMPPPIEGRVLQKSGSAGGGGSNQVDQLLGVGGVAAEDTTGQTFRDLSKNPPTTFGGQKIWVHPQQASISHRGTIKLRVAPADKASYAIWEDQVDPAYAGQIERLTENALHRESLPRDISSYLSGRGLAEDRSRGLVAPGRVERPSMVKIMEQYRDAGIRTKV